MKILKRLFTIAFAVSLVVFLSGFSDKNNNFAAEIYEDGVCGIPQDLDHPELGFYMGTVHSVTNHGGNSLLICKSKDLIGTGDKREWRGFPCGTYLGNTLDSYLVISADGNATLRCQVKKAKK